MVSGFTVLTYVRPLLEGLTGFGGEGIGLMLLAFGLAGVGGSIFGGYGADRWGYRTTAVQMIVILGFSLLTFSLLPAIEVGSAFVIVGAGMAMVAWGAVVFALIPLQQHHLIRVALDEQNGVLSLNSSAVYVGQGLGAGLGSQVLGHLSLAALGYAGALLAVAALVGLVFAARLSLGVTDREALPESPAERRSGPSAPKVFPCPQP
jgi:MFS transporter, DHA1 family, inner membrane transport protein